MNEHKREFVLNFLQELIGSPQFRPFLHFDDLAFGLFDAQFITKSKGLSLRALKKDVTSRKTLSSQWFAAELRKIFLQVSDYILLSDPFQETCQKGLSMVDQFQKQYAELFRKKIAQEQRGRSNGSLSLCSQLEMIFYLKGYEEDEELMVKIGEVCKVLGETDSEYLFDLSSSPLWLSMIERTHNQD